MSLLAVGPGARARTCYAALRVAAPLWEVLRFDGRARRLVELCGQAIASEGRADAAAALLEGAEGFRWLPGGEVVSQLVGRALAAGGAAIADPHEGAGEGAVEGGGREYAALGWAAASLARLPLHERGLVRSNPGADLPLGVGQALRGQRTGAPTRDAYAPRPPLGISQAQWPQGSTPARVQRQDRLPAGPWEGGPGGIQTLVVAVARQLEPWCLDGTELPGIEAAQ
ncbi:MAG: hypothetical protein JKY65_22090 [Planctomycetes bacterium]|nr:hypothetical protein [Planctomycetota bacterium]